MEPLYTHDCATCLFVGSAEDADVYIHPYTETQRPGFVARFSSDPPDYQSITPALVGRVFQARWAQAIIDILMAP